ncbi:MAG: MerR family transcriptional regulator [Bacillota bacterium]
MIDKEKRYFISEVSKIVGYDTHVLRYYENEFNIDIPRTESNRRYYTYLEIEKFVYIKQLQEKGLTNTQIKDILNSPEVVIDNAHDSEDGVMLMKINGNEEMLGLSHYSDIHEAIRHMSLQISATIDVSLEEKLLKTRSEIMQHVESVMKEINKRYEEQEDSQVDILKCENARMKMKLKEKSYEVAELKEKIRRLSQKKDPIWKRIFKNKKDVAI